VTNGPPLAQEKSRKLSPKLSPHHYQSTQTTPILSASSEKIRMVKTKGNNKAPGKTSTPRKGKTLEQIRREKSKIKEKENKCSTKKAKKQNKSEEFKKITRLKKIFEKTEEYIPLPTKKLDNISVRGLLTNFVKNDMNLEEEIFELSLCLEKKKTMEAEEKPKGVQEKIRKFEENN
jgi:hypothetical protein